MVFPATFSMAGTFAHYQAIVSGDLSKVKTFLQNHPDALNTVRSPLPFLLFREWGRRRKKRKRRRRGTHHNGDAFRE
jgi:hypothetical protein